MRDIFKVLIDDINTEIQRGGSKVTKIVQNPDNTFDENQTLIEVQQEQIENTEARLRRTLKNLQSQPKYKKKYEMFYFLLEKHSTQGKYLRLFSFRRSLVYVILLTG